MRELCEGVRVEVPREGVGEVLVLDLARHGGDVGGGVGVAPFCVIKMIYTSDKNVVVGNYFYNLLEDFKKTNCNQNFPNL